MGTNLSAGIMSAKAAPSNLAQRIMSRTSKGCTNAAILMLADERSFTAAPAELQVRHVAKYVLTLRSRDILKF